MHDAKRSRVTSAATDTCGYKIHALIIRSPCRRDCQRDAKEEGVLQLDCSQAIRRRIYVFHFKYWARKYIYFSWYQIRSLRDV